MSSKFRAIKIDSDVSLEDIAEVIQGVLEKFSNPINYSVVFYNDAEDNSIIVELVAFLNKDASYLGEPDKCLLNSISLSQREEEGGFVKKILSKIKPTSEQPSILPYVFSITAISLARELSLSFKTATALIVSDTLCECGHLIFENGAVKHGVLVSPNGYNSKIEILDNEATISDYSVSNDYHKYFHPNDELDVEEYLDSLEYRGRIQIMVKNKKIQRSEFVLEET